MADKFRSSKDAIGGATVIRKGSKYDKDSKHIARKYKGSEAFGDMMTGANVAVAAKQGKKRAEEGDKKRTSNDTYEYLAGADRPSSKGRKDFKFFKHTTKGK